MIRDIPDGADSIPDFVKLAEAYGIKVPCLAL